jgi:hypothetical protein
MGTSSRLFPHGCVSALTSPWLLYMLPLAHRLRNAATVLASIHGATARHILPSLAICRLPCPPRPILDLHILATPLRCHCTTACVRRSLRDSACGALTNTCRCACHPHDHSLPPLLACSSFPSPPFAPSPPLFFPISVLTYFFLSPPPHLVPSRPAAPCRPTAQSCTRAD